MAEVSLKLSVEVLLAVNFVHKRVKADSIRSILIQEKDANFVDLVDSKLRIGEQHMMIVEKIFARVRSFSINLELSDLETSEVEPGVIGRKLSHGKAHIYAAREVVTPREIQLDIVAHIFEAFGSNNTIFVLNKHV